MTATLSMKLYATNMVASAPTFGLVVKVAECELAG
jgi:hypothetical protein